MNDSKKTTETSDERTTLNSEQQSKNESSIFEENFSNENPYRKHKPHSQATKWNLENAILQLQWNSISTISIKEHTFPEKLFNELCKCTSLKELYWCSIPLDLETITKLTEVLMKNKNITYVSLYGAKIGDEAARVFANCLKNNSSLVSLSLQNNCLGVVGTEALTNALSENDCLKELNLSDNWLMRDEGAFSIAKMLSKSKTLESLNTSNGGFKNEGMKSIVQSLLTSNDSLKKLSTKKSVFDGEVINLLRELLEKKPNFQLSVDVSLEKPKPKLPKRSLDTFESIVTTTTSTAATTIHKPSKKHKQQQQLHHSPTPQPTFLTNSRPSFSSFSEGSSSTRNFENDFLNWKASRGLANIPLTTSRLDGFSLATTPTSNHEFQLNQSRRPDSDSLLATLATGASRFEQERQVLFQQQQQLATSFAQIPISESPRLSFSSMSPSPSDLNQFSRMNSVSRRLGFEVELTQLRSYVIEGIERLQQHIDKRYRIIQEETQHQMDELRRLFNSELQLLNQHFQLQIQQLAQRIHSNFENDQQ